MTVEEAKEAHIEYVKIINELHENKEICKKEYPRNYDLICSKIQQPSFKYIERIGKDKFNKISKSYTNLIDLNNLDSKYNNLLELVSAALQGDFESLEMIESEQKAERMESQQDQTRPIKFPHS